MKSLQQDLQEQEQRVVQSEQRKQLLSDSLQVSGEVKSNLLLITTLTGPFVLVSHQHSACLDVEGSAFIVSVVWQHMVLFNITFSCLSGVNERSV